MIIKSMPLIILIVMTILIIPVSNLAQSESAADSSIHSSIVQANGYAYLAEDKTIRQIRQEALVNAKREALEKCQTYVQSFTKLVNLDMIYDLVQTQSEGAVRILESKDHGITEKNRYHIWIKAEVVYNVSKKPEVQNDIDLSSTPAAPLNIKCWTDKPIYESGDHINILLKSNKDFYTRILYINTKGDILQLLPNQHRTETLFKGKKQISIPDITDGFQIRVSPPFGKEKIVVYASTAPIGDIEKIPYGDALFKPNQDMQTISKESRIIGDTLKGDGELFGAEFYETAVNIKTVEEL